MPSSPAGSPDAPGAPSRAGAGDRVGAADRSTGAPVTGRRRPNPTHLVIAGAVVLALILVGTVAVRALGGRDLSPAAFDRWLASGSVAGVAQQLTSPPTQPAIDVAAEQASYGGAPSCGEYFSYARQHLQRQAEAQPNDPASALVDGISAELWSAGATAEEGQRRWTACLADYQAATGRTSHPLTTVDHGDTHGVAWEYAESLELGAAVHVLSLRQRNVVVTLALPDAPDPDQRDQLAERFRAELDAVTG